MTKNPKYHMRKSMSDLSKINTQISVSYNLLNDENLDKKMPLVFKTRN